MNKKNVLHQKDNVAYLFYCLIAATVFITICSKCSFIYPMNDWGDANCYYVLGKGMLSGFIPYRDYYEQKGIVIFTLYAIGILISKNSFLGIYFIEIICLAVLLFFALKIFSLFFEINNYAFILVFFLASSICSSALFCHGGSPEELLLPLFTYGLYLGLKYFEKNEHPDKLEMFVFGLFAGLIFFSKFVLCIFYLSIILFLIIKAFICKNTHELIKNTPMFLLGCVITIIPVIIYFVAEDSLSDFLYVYFYKNIHNYTPETSFSNFSEIVKHYVFYASFFFRKRNIVIISLILLGEVWLVLKKKYFIAIFQLFTFFSFYCLEFVLMRPRKYYGLPLAIFIIFGTCAIIDYFEHHKIKVIPISKTFFAIFLILLAIVFTDNRLLYA